MLARCSSHGVAYQVMSCCSFGQQMCMPEACRLNLLQAAVLQQLPAEFQLLVMLPAHESFREHVPLPLSGCALTQIA